MKKLHILALTVALALVAHAGPAFAQYQVKAYDGPGSKDGRLKWVRAATISVTDSTVISIPAWGGSVAVGTAQDTTEWVDLRSYRFAATAASMPLLEFQINHQAAVASDTVYYQVQTANDPNDRTMTTGFANGSLTTLEPAAGISMTTVVALTSNGGRASLARLIVRNAKVGTGATRRNFSVVAIPRGWKD